MTGILLLPTVQFATAAPSNADMLDVICTFLNNGTPIDLTGIAFRSQIRSSATDATLALDAQTSNWASADVTTPNGLLVSGGTAGWLSWAIPQSKLGALSGQAFVTDILARADGHFALVGTGSFTVAKSVTRWSPQV